MNAPDLKALLAKFKEYNPNQDTSLIEKAYYFAQNAHKDQKRESGEPYFARHGGRYRRYARRHPQRI